MRLPPVRCLAPGLVVLFVSGLVGCGGQRSGSVVLATPSVSAPSILRSEAEQIGAPVRVDAPLRFENQSDEDQFIAVSRTGCSCYGMATKEFLLQPGEKLKIPRRGTRELFFVTQLVDGEGAQGFRVGFTIGGIDVATGPAANEELRAECSMKVLPDLVVEPSLLVVDLPAEGEASAGRTFEISVQRVTRGRPEKMEPPQLMMKPELLKAEPFRQVGEPGEVEPGLWRVEWKGTLQLGELPADIVADGGRFPFSVEFPEQHEPPVRRNRPRPEDAMPTVLDVVVDQGDRRVSGQLVLRRSAGVIAPGEIHFGVVPSGETRTRRLVLTAADQSPFVAKVEKAPAGVAVEFDSTEPAAQQWVSLTFAADSPGEVDEQLEVSTSHPEQPLVRVRLKAKVTAADGNRRK